MFIFVQVRVFLANNFHSHVRSLLLHIYADDTQVYLCCNLDNLDESRVKIEHAIADVRSWMIKSKLKINDQKTEFFIKLLITRPASLIKIDFKAFGDRNSLLYTGCKSLFTFKAYIG